MRTIIGAMFTKPFEIEFTPWKTNMSRENKWLESMYFLLKYGQTL